MVQAKHKIGFKTLRHTLLLATQQSGNYLDMHGNRYALTGRLLSDRRRSVKQHRGLKATSLIAHHPRHVMLFEQFPTFPQEGFPTEFCKIVDRLTLQIGLIVFFSIFFFLDGRLSSIMFSASSGASSSPRNRKYRAVPSSCLVPSFGQYW